MATSKNVEADTQDAPEQQPEPPPEPQTESEGTYYKLPPTLAEAGGVGVVGVVSGLYTVSNGSYQISPGQAHVMSAEDAQALVDQGVVVMLDQYKTT